MKTARLFLLVAAISALPGCGYLVNGYYQASGWTSRQWSAEKAWRARKWMYADIPCPGSFKAGFKAGYRFANGGYDSCEPPQMRHYWRVGHLSDTERQNAQAWSDGFTHGTVAAQQDHTAGVSALDTAAMQPPPGVPDLQYVTPPPTNEMSDSGGYQYSPYGQSPYGQLPYGQLPYGQTPYGQSPMPYDESQSQGSQFVPPGQTYFPYGPNPGNPQFAPSGQPYEYSPSPYSPPQVPPPAPASEAAPSNSGSMPLPPPAPASQPAANLGYVPNGMMASEGSPGLGSLQTVGNLQPAPPAEMGGPSMRTSPSILPPSPIAQPTEWQLPVTRD
jgi:hypothetical protein